MAAKPIQETPDLSEPSQLDKDLEHWGSLLPFDETGKAVKNGNALLLKQKSVRIGRDEDCDVTINCPQLSGSHCTLHFEAEDCVVRLEDHSRNGCWVNRRRVHKRETVVKHMDEIMFVPESTRRKRKKVVFLLQLMSEMSALAAAKRGLGLDVNYYFVKELGHGAFAQVKQYRHRDTGDVFAVKVINRKEWQKLQRSTKRAIKLTDEVKLMAAAKHPHIVQVHEYFSEKDRVHVVMDYLGGGDMLDYIQANGAYNESLAKRVFLQLVSAIEYLHSLNIAHRDLKPDNILLQDTDSALVKVADFGISRKTTDSQLCQTIIGTPLYQAPEVALHRSLRTSDRGYDGRLADYWSLGIILFVMVTAAPPAEEPSAVAPLVSAKKLKWWDNARPISEECKHLVYALLKLVGTDRIGAAEIYEHKWFDDCRDFVEEMKRIGKADARAKAAATAATAASQDEEDTKDSSLDERLGGICISREERPKKRSRSDLDAASQTGAEVPVPKKPKSASTQRMVKSATK